MADLAGRLIIDPPASGPWNMSVDQVLLQTAEESGLATLRIYFWEPATVSLGYFQIHDHRQEHAGSVSCPLVRRKTGGGAIVHDQEVTYSLCLPSSQRWSSKNRQLYDRIHQTLIEFLGQYSINTHLFGDPGHRNVVPENDPFLCFQRRAIGDLMIGEHKVGGSAQRRLKRSLLQHGSILLSRSKFAPELPGVADLADSYPTAQEFTTTWAGMVADCLSIQFSSDSLQGVELRAAEKVQDEVFSSPEWNHNR